MVKTIITMPGGKLLHITTNPEFVRFSAAGRGEVYKVKPMEFLTTSYVAGRKVAEGFATREEVEKVLEIARTRKYLVEGSN